MKVSIIIPNWNGKHIMEKNLPSVLEAAKFDLNLPVEVIVSDDCSDDGSVDFLKSYFPEVVVVVGKKHEGFSATCNRGAERATGDILLFLNSDIVPDRDFITKVVPYFSDSSVFAVGCMDRSVEPDGSIVLRGKGIGSFQRGFLNHAKGTTNAGVSLWANGGSSAFSKEKFMQLGGFDTLYAPFYYEDIDLSYRAWKRGWKVLFEPRSQVLHKHEEGAIKTNFTKEYIKIISYRNQFLFVWKNITDVPFILSHFVLLPYHFVKALIRGDFEFFEGFFLALKKLPLALDHRSKGKRVWTDKEVFERAGK